MTPVRIRHLTKTFGMNAALNEVSLEIGPGELFFLLGPSGSGKTTLLRCLAGFHRPDSGTIQFGEEDVTPVPPHRRNIGMMFQGYALWPHLTVAQNVAFGLEERRIPRDEIRRRVGEALESVHMAAEAERRPGELSGGQQQRVALARALVIRPRCLLLDEPLSNLDAKLRQELRAEIRRVCRSFNVTTVYVTHDQKDALAMADRMAVLERGRILQVGTPRELYRRPSCTRVASFIGETDLIPGRVDAVRGERAEVETAIGRFEGIWAGAGRVQIGAAVTLCVRPECWSLHRDPVPGNLVRGRIGEAVYLGEAAQYVFTTGAQALKVLESNPRFLDPASSPEIYAAVAAEDVVVLPD